MLKLILIIVALFTIFCAENPQAVADAKEATMDAIYLPVGRLSLTPPVGVVSRRAAVAFPHSLHFDYTCQTCHHQWDGYAPVRGCMTIGCHDRIVPQKVNAPGATAKVADIRYYKAAYHKKCISCHRGLTIERQKLEGSKAVLSKPLPKTGPTGCIECHPKN